MHNGTFAANPLPLRLGARSAVPTSDPIFDMTNAAIPKRSVLGSAVRSVVPRLVLSKMAVGTVFSLLAFFATENLDKRFLAAISSVVCLVAAYHYRSILLVRGQEKIPEWLKPSDLKSSNRDDIPPARWLQFEEFQVDLLRCALRICASFDPKPSASASEPRPESCLHRCRHSDWAITLVLLVYKLYTYAGRTGGLFGIYDPWVAALYMFLSIALGFFFRFATDELAPFTNRRCKPQSLLFGVVCFLGATAFMVFVVVDLIVATEGIADKDIIRLFVLVWCFYPAVSALTVLGRQCLKPDADANIGDNGYNAYLSMFKDISYGVLDVISKVFFAFYTCWACFERPGVQGEPTYWSPPSAPS